MTVAAHRDPLPPFSNPAASVIEDQPVVAIRPVALVFVDCDPDALLRHIQRAPITSSSRWERAGYVQRRGVGGVYRRGD
jgi:hypothetical protein